MSLAATCTNWQNLKPPEAPPPVRQMVLLIIGFLPARPLTPHSWSPGFKTISKKGFTYVYGCVAYMDVCAPREFSAPLGQYKSLILWNWS